MKFSPRNVPDAFTHQTDNLFQPNFNGDDMCDFETFKDELSMIGCFNCGEKNFQIQHDPAGSYSYDCFSCGSSYGATWNEMSGTFDNFEKIACGVILLHYPWHDFGTQIFFYGLLSDDELLAKFYALTKDQQFDASRSFVVRLHEGHTPHTLLWGTPNPCLDWCEQFGLVSNNPSSPQVTTDSDDITEYELFDFQRGPKLDEDIPF